MALYHHLAEEKNLNAALEGAVVVRVEPGGVDEAHFILVLQRPQKDGKPGKEFSVRISGTDLGWWAETRAGSKGKWRDV